MPGVFQCASCHKMFPSSHIRELHISQTTGCRWILKLRTAAPALIPDFQAPPAGAPSDIPPHTEQVSDTDVFMEYDEDPPMDQDPPSDVAAPSPPPPPPPPANPTSESLHNAAHRTFVEDDLAEGDDIVYVESIEGAGCVHHYDEAVRAVYEKLSKNPTKGPGREGISFGPFKSQMDYDIACWAMEGGPSSQNSFTRLLAIEGVSLIPAVVL